MSLPYLILEPEELAFRRPFTRVVTENLVLKNNNDFNVAFKVKTTMPKRYCVRPNSGVIEPRSSLKVLILLQAMKEDPKDAKKDKFQVQSAKVLSGGEPDWNDKDTVQQSKLRCVFLPEAPSSGVAVASSTNEDSASELKSSIATETPPVDTATGSTDAINDEYNVLKRQYQVLQNSYNKLKDESLRKRPVGGTSGASSAIATKGEETSLPITIVLALVALFIGLMLGRYM